MTQVKSNLHPFTILHHMQTESMEQNYSELFLRTTELEAVRDHVQMECEAFRHLFERITTAMSSADSQHNRRLNHTEAGRHFPQQFGGSRYYGDLAFRMEGNAAVVSRERC